ncbi:AbrB/MazE/SpoVT family DNA-binding domain-containing protein [Priestia megaterium]|uniref:AbrB/MazE/SpoVT family DNA-binding domain-containing protein n=1 Tax=Priestia megaterium TaxID=1404 RepID=UPI001C2135A6|nr:AbrB/MazE/SpoVT family DNA-binding domain-containing protein [Priestia megaterium]MBU8589282.1 AbrB/MazE/SpoVT family DNA-binding domain-containing protein [Priestia megaterium]MED4134053.1 AbrB/MazE/SpoVT family DNA-binding domain-containing protein [Priestia megaterium]NGY80582.1 AbrB/MazE/SpoVT family DNA-binding domain-containing protein [Priestia megaterium]
MKSTGIVRKIDQLGRVVLPSELRKVLDIKDQTPVEIYVEGNQIIFQKYQASQACVITGEVTKENKVYPGNLVLSPEGAQQLFNQLKNKSIESSK